jgi:hypothetical protein
MSLVQTFVDAFKKGVGKRPAQPEVDVKSVGTMGSVPEGYADRFDPLRPAPESGSGKGIDHGGVSVGGEPQVASGDPEEGGEVTGPSA